MYCLTILVSNNFSQKNIPRYKQTAANAQKAKRLTLRFYL